LSIEREMAQKIKQQKCSWIKFNWILIHENNRNWSESLRKFLHNFKAQQKEYYIFSPVVSKQTFKKWNKKCVCKNKIFKKRRKKK
jgi:hypothetical protein